VRPVRAIFALVVSDLKPVPRVGDGAQCWFQIRHDQALIGGSVLALGMGLGLGCSQVPCPARERERGEFSLGVRGGFAAAGVGGWTKEI
jgi:hypothetical protein